MDRIALNRRFFGLLRSLAIDKETFYEARGIASLAELSDTEVNTLCEELFAALRHAGVQPQQRVWRSDSANVRSWRSNCLRLLQSLGVYYVAPGDDNAAVWSRVNAFCRLPRIAGAEFRDLSVEQLRTLYRKLSTLRDKGYYHHRQAQPIEAVEEFVRRSITNVQ